MSQIPAPSSVFARASDAAPDEPRDPFEDIVHQNIRGVTHAAYQITQNIDDARDVAQFVFMQMFVKSPPFDSQRAIDRWLYVVTRNYALHVQRRRQRDASAEPLEDREISRPGLEDTVLANERDDLVRETIARLPPAYRQIIELRHLKSMPTAEIAQTLGIPVARVKRDAERATFRLRVEMMRRGLDREVN